MRGWALLVLAGCGRLAFEPVADAQDAPFTFDDSHPELPMFANPAPIAGLASAFTDDDPAITSDGLELIFSSDRTGNGDLFVSQRASRSDPWPPETAIPQFTSIKVEKGPEFSDDGLTLWLYFGGDIAMSTRATRTSPWSAPQVILVVSGEPGTPSVCDGDRQMVLREKINTINKLYVTTRASTAATWPDPSPLGDVISSAAESGPWVTSDCNRIYFDSQDVGTPRMYVVDRDPQSGAFGAARFALDPAVGNVHDASLTDDERYVVFAHKVAGLDQIWEASR
ncbi:MAG TPA: hypothetical protein VL326_01100 [Kofleriaceae bacterium]|nr:hypothetical protein [Kofleriaceae bacterium]